MHWLFHLGLAGILCAGGDVIRPTYLQPPRADATQVLAQAAPAPPPEVARPDEKQQGERAERLRPESRIDLVRYVSGEFAKAVRPLPGGKKGFRFTPGQPLDEKHLRQLSANSGYAARPGDMVQITRLEFRDKEIYVDINGGGRQGRRWRDRIQVSIGGASTVQRQGPVQGYQGLGSTLILDFGRPIPDLTPDELKQFLAPLLDFATHQRSAAVHWVETLPPEFQAAIKDRRVVPGMDREMVIAAVGRPDRKVRERDPNGVETEDWIYGDPPAKVVFVKFAGERVVSVREFP